jgi:hypothetical protein
MNWISVRTQQPDTHGSFIVNTENGVGIAKYNRGMGFHEIILTGNVQYSSQTVSHWMPFPEQAPAYIEINADTRFDYALNGTQSSFTLAELEEISTGKNANDVAPGWLDRNSTGLRLPRSGSRGYNGNDMGHDYMYRYKNGTLSEFLPMTWRDDS